MFISKFPGSAVIACILLNVLTAVAFADDRHRRQPDVDIESLKSELRWINGEWLLEVRYKVEVEDYRPLPGELELILMITEHGRTLVDDNRNPIEFIVPLEYPSEEDDDELEFEDRITITLPQGDIGDPDHLRLESAVVRVNDGYPSIGRKSRSKSNTKNATVGVWASESALARSQSAYIVVVDTITALFITAPEPHTIASALLTAVLALPSAGRAMFSDTRVPGNIAQRSVCAADGTATHTDQTSDRPGKDEPHLHGQGHIGNTRLLAAADIKPIPLRLLNPGS